MVNLLNVNITDPNVKRSAEVDNAQGERQALIVATRPLKTFDGAIKHFTSVNGSTDMNVNGSVTGVLELVYDEDTEWGSSNIVGTTFIFDDGGPAVDGPKNGSVCIDATASTNNNTMQLDNGGDFDLTPYSFLTGWIYITGWSVAGTKEVLISGYDTNTSSVVGVTADIGNYVNTGAFNVWQEFIIPFTDMMLEGETIDALRIITVDIGAGPPPDYFLDVIEFEEPAGDGPQKFAVVPDIGTWLYVQTVQHTLVDVLDTAYADASMPNLSYDKFLAVSKLPVGTLYRRIMDGDVKFSILLQCLLDLIMFPNSTISNFGSDGTNTFLTVNQQLIEPLVLRSETTDMLQFTVEDDLSDLLLYRTSIMGRVETRM